MSRIVRSGVFLLAITLAVVGAATSAGSSKSKEPDLRAGNSAAPQLEPEESVRAAQTKVPLRSGDVNSSAFKTPSAVPVEVRIAEIGLQASISPVGVDDQNQLDVPSADTVGWYQHSSSPGSDGATVLAAHVDYAGAKGAFFNLASLSPGETLDLEMDDGSILRYQVTGNTEYDKKELPADELFRKDGAPVLQLITCGGTFNPQERSYSANVVVTAELV